ncbi:MAG: hypothetical protein ACK5B9_15465 [Flavobacteriia bacterium]|jgi:hypothetical protein
MKTKFIFLALISIQFTFSQISLTGGASTQNFNTLANSGTSSTLPTAWVLTESGTGANTTYTAGTGSGTAGDSYSFGASGSSDRALGGLQSGSVIPSIGASFTNNTSSLIISLLISYTGEQWRLGATGRNDKLDFQYSLNATSLITGTWTDVNTLDFTAPNSTGTVGALDGNLAANKVSISASITSLSIANGATFWIRWTDLNATSSDDGLGIDDFSITPTTSACSAASEPTTLASNITVSEGCTSAQLNFTAGNGANRMIVMSTDCTITDPSDHTNYTSNSTFGSGSEVGGSTTEDFVVYDGSLGTTIVDGLTPGATYCFKIYEYNGSSTCVEYLTTGVSSTSFTTTSGASCSTPQIRAILVNTCETDEGTDEYFVISNGSSALNLNDVRVTFPSIAASWCNSGCGTQTIGNNSTYVGSLNTTAGCTLFQYNTTIPANATLIIFTGSNPPTLFDYSSECPGGGPYYVAFCNNTNTTGRFANTTSTGPTRTLTVDFGGASDAVTYAPSAANTGDNGDYCSFDNAGNVTYGNVPTCSAPIPLPMELGKFSVEGLQNKIEINWETLSERNLDYFEIQLASFEDEEFQFAGYEKANGNTTEKKSYHQTIANVEAGEYYLRLKNVDFDGEITYTDPLSLSVFNESNAIKSILNFGDFQEISFYENLERNSEIKIFDLTGKVIYQEIIRDETNKIRVQLQSNILHFLQISESSDLIQSKFVIR